MVEIDNETLCILAVVFMVIIILMYMSRSNKEYTTPCGMKIASRYGTNPITDTSANSQNNPFVMLPKSGYAVTFNKNNQIAGGEQNAGGNQYSGNIPLNVDAGRGPTNFIYPPDVIDPQYVPAFGISKGINEISGNEFINPLPASPFSMKIVPSNTLTKY